MVNNYKTDELEYMRFEIELCHIDSNRIVVKATAWSDNGSLGSALGEDSFVDQAEIKAIKKLEKRLGIENKIIDYTSTSNLIDSTYNSKTTLPDERKENNIRKEDNNKESIKNQNSLKISMNETNEDINLPKIPDDWSKELALIDNHLSKLSWDKESENIYLSKLLGYNSRSKITSYTDLRIYLNNLRTLTVGTNSCDIQIDKNSLINKTSILLDKLSWDSLKGREFINNRFLCKSRTDLSQKQLLEFIMLLEDLISSKGYF